MTSTDDRSYPTRLHIRSLGRAGVPALTTPDFTMYCGAELTSDWQVGSPLEAVHPTGTTSSGSSPSTSHRLSYTSPVGGGEAAAAADGRRVHDLAVRRDE
ncbi:hypothetical protein HBB16_20065 [Pseudonocardia sp. MCCB 268]|nr:hypothetical protein [Pseudonocardia cytotoxica]